MCLEQYVEVVLVHEAHIEVEVVVAAAAAAEIGPQA